jgi:hypothetical protein
MDYLCSFPVNRISPVLFFPFIGRTFRDYSGLENHSSVSDTDLKWIRSRGVDQIFSGSLLVQNTTKLQAIDNWSLFVFGELESPMGSSTPRIISKRDGGGTHFEVFLTFDQIRVFNGSIAVASVATLNGFDSLCITHENGEKPKTYLNDTFFGEMSNPITTTPNDANIYLKGLYTGSGSGLDRSRIGVLILFDDILEAEEVPIIRSWCRQRLSPLISPSRHRYLFSSVKFHENWGCSRPTILNAVSGEYISGTEWQVISGSWAIKEDKDKAYLECVTDGKVRYVSLNGASGWATEIFEQLSGAPSLTKNTGNIEIDGVTGDQVGEILLIS